jgi:hypothetical protein
VRPRGHPEDEERRFGLKLVQQPEQRVRLALECRTGLAPLARAEPAADELMPVLEVDAQQQGALVAVDVVWGWRSREVTRGGSARGAKMTCPASKEEP